MLVMKKLIIYVMLFLLLPFLASAQDIFGKWKTIDDETGEEKSIVEIYRDNGKVYGKIVEILNPANKNVLCEKCEGEEKNKPVLGLVLIKDMEKEGEYYKQGTIFDPERGKKYKCRLGLKDSNTLEVRGYISFLYATQYWERVIN